MCPVRSVTYVSGRSTGQFLSSFAVKTCPLASRGFVMGPEELVIGLDYAIRQDSCELFPDDRTNAGT